MNNVGSFRAVDTLQQMPRAGVLLIALSLMTSCATPDLISAQSSSADPGYRLGPEDVVMISVWKDVNLTR